jgi:hypothetical protein
VELFVRISKLPRAMGIFNKDAEVAMRSTELQSWKILTGSKAEGRSEDACAVWHREAEIVRDHPGMESVKPCGVDSTSSFAYLYYDSPYEPPGNDCRPRSLRIEHAILTSRSRAVGHTVTSRVG